MDIVSSELSARLHVVGTFTRKEKIVVERIDFILDVIQLLATVLGLHFVPALCDLIVGYMSVYQYQIGIKLSAWNKFCYGRSGYGRPERIIIPKMTDVRHSMLFTDPHVTIPHMTVSRLVKNSHTSSLVTQPNDLATRCCKRETINVCYRIRVNHSSKAKKIITNSWSTWIKLCQFKGNMDPMLGSPHMSLRPDFGAFRNITASMRFDNSVSPILSEIHFAF